MADYPLLPINADDYSNVPNDGSQVTRADDGTARVRRLYATTIYQIHLTHPMLTAAQFADLESFYYANRNERVNFVDPMTGSSYKALMLGPPRPMRVVAGTMLDAGMELEGSRE